MIEESSSESAREVLRAVPPLEDDDFFDTAGQQAEPTPQLARGIVWSDLLAEMAAEESVRRSAA